MRAVCLGILQVMTKTANLLFMKLFGIKLLSIILLLTHLVLPAQAVVASISDMAETKSEHCMQKMQHTAKDDIQSKADCCQQAKACDEVGCSQCQSCAAVVMLVNLHRQTVIPTLSATSLVHVADYLQGISTKNLYRPPINTL